MFISASPLNTFWTKASSRESSSWYLIIIYAFRLTHKMDEEDKSIVLQKKSIEHTHVHMQHR